MKHGSLWVGVLSLVTASAFAIELNTDAMKKMQEEGEKILEEKQALQAFRLPNGNCLQAAGDPGKAGTNVVARKCNDKAKNQKWQIDGQGRLQSHGGLCVALTGDKPGANVVLEKCGGSKDQHWVHNDAGQVKSKTGVCLQANGGNVIGARCGNAANQKWE